MGAPDLLQHLRDSGLQLEVDGDLLTVKPRDRLTDEMRQAIREFKPALLALLAGAKPEPIQAAYWPNTEHATDAELDVMEARLMLLASRGMDDAEAGKLVDRLLRADRDQTGQVTCHLCQHFNPRRKTCGNFRSAGVWQEIGSDLAGKLQRCPGYAATRQ
ncbi:MAG: hypothetical protein K2W93_11365 [Burkholderiaceae bacterium]|nr:hypothetical protein [Burkholderiaceae bacterium]